MGINLAAWLNEKIFGRRGIDAQSIDECLCEAHIRELAFNSAVALIANAISKCEFRTYVSGVEVKRDEYYLWNVEPNANQSSSAFIHKWLHVLYKNNACLIIEQSGKLLVADSYQREEDAIAGDRFYDVVVDETTFRGPYLQRDVLFYRLRSEDMNKIAGKVFESYQKLLGYAMKSFSRSRGQKGVYYYGSMPAAGTTEREAFEKLVNENIKKWLEADSAALPLGKGQEWKESQQKTYSTESSRDIRAMIDDVSDFYAKAFSIPPALLRGDVAGIKDAVDALLTFCIDPLADFLAEEINRKRMGRANFLAGSRIEIYTGAIQHKDILDAAAGIEKLISSGAFSVNDVLRELGRQAIQEPWADEHFITKNFERLSDALAAMNERSASR